MESNAKFSFCAGMLCVWIMKFGQIFFMRRKNTFEAKSKMKSKNIIWSMFVGNFLWNLSTCTCLISFNSLASGTAVWIHSSIRRWLKLSKTFHMNPNQRIILKTIESSLPLMREVHSWTSRCRHYSSIQWFESLSVRDRSYTFSI